jgi:glycosyltransferase involved in cell wall biosynthesis
MPKNSVLLVTRGFPPYAASLGGAMRMLKLAEFLTERGYDVHVVAGKGRWYGTFGYDALLGRLNLHYFDDPVMARSGPVQAAAEGESRPAGWRGAFKPLINEVLIPDTGVLGLPRLRTCAQAVIERFGITRVISSGPPHTDHLVGLLLKKRYGNAIRWIADYRDSWNGTALFRKRLAPLQAINRILERAVLRGADMVTYISPPMGGKLSRIAACKGIESKCHLVMNGYDAAMALRSAPPWHCDDGPLTIGYFGAIDDRTDSYRNPSLLLRTVAERSLDVRFEFYGTARLAPEWQLVLGERILMGGVLSHDEAFRRMQQCDVLMLLHTQPDGADEVITGKVFEYLLAGRPVLAIGPACMAVNSVLDELGAGLQVEHDQPRALVEALEQLIRRKRHGQLESAIPPGLTKYSRQAQYERLVELLG